VSLALYEIVAQRRLQWDNLVWQVPVLSLTAQAFLFTIALSAGNGQYARAVASALAFAAAILSMLLMSRHRKGEITDAHWLRAYEEANFGRSFHGSPWQEARDRESVGGPFSQLGGYVSWMFGFSLFAAAALASFVLTFTAPDLFH
jgi:hypothetical protein